MVHGRVLLALVALYAAPKASALRSGLRSENLNAISDKEANAGENTKLDKTSVIEDSDATKNPIRKVVTLLQNLAKKIESEGKTEKDLFEKFVCYCKTTGAELEQSIATSTGKVPELQTTIEQSEAEKAQIKVDLKAHQSDLAAVKVAMEEATNLREKEAAEFEKEAGEARGYLKGLNSAIAAVESGMAGTSLVQSSSAGATLRRALSSSKLDITDDDRQLVTAFLAGAEVYGYVPKSGEVLGIIKNMRDDYAKILKQLEFDESEAVKTYDELMAAKGKEQKSLDGSIERKTARDGELAVSIASMKDDLTDTQAALIEDQKLQGTLATDCKTKQKDFEERVAMRGQELVAVQDTIKILNDDDALELFKKTLPGASFADQDSRLIQMNFGRQLAQRKVVALLHTQDDSMSSATRGGSTLLETPNLGFLELALASGKVDFSKVIKMIDDMVKILAEEQQDDDQKKDYCGKSMDNVEDKLKTLGNKESDHETAIADSKATMAQLKEDVKLIQKGISELDKNVRDATEQRKEENEEFTELMSGNTAAKELLEFAKNRLNKFYNPKLYKAPPKSEEMDLEQVVADVAGVALLQVSDRSRYHDEPKGPPKVGSYKKSGEESTGVIAMIDLLIRDLDKEMVEAETQEKGAQKEYERVMSGSAKKRATDISLIKVKEQSAADTEEALVALDGELASTQMALMASKQYEGQLHSECDWLLKYFDLRKAARAEESDNLSKAKATLSGADFSLLQSHQPAAALLSAKRGVGK